MRFLIDENLSPMLVDLARERGYETMTLRDLGMLNAKHWTLLQKDSERRLDARHQQRSRNRKCYAHGAVLHAGAVFLADVDSGRDVQRLAFALAVDDIDPDADLVIFAQVTIFANKGGNENRKKRFKKLT
jgi:hypothetical protein